MSEEVFESNGLHVTGVAKPGGQQLQIDTDGEWAMLDEDEATRLARALLEWVEGREFKRQAKVSGKEFSSDPPHRTVIERCARLECFGPEAKPCPHIECIQCGSSTSTYFNLPGPGARIAMVCVEDEGSRAKRAAEEKR